MFVCVHVCIYMWSQRATMGVIFRDPPPLLLWQCLSLTGLDGLSPRDLPRIFPIFPAHCQAWHFNVDSEDSTQVLMLVRQILYCLGYLLSPAPQLFKFDQMILLGCSYLLIPEELINIYNSNFFSWNRVLHSPGWPVTHYVVEDDLKFLTFLSLSSKC